MALSHERRRLALQGGFAALAGEEVAGGAHDHRREQDQRDEVRERHQSVEDVGNAPHHRDGEVGTDRDHGDIEEPVAFDDVCAVHPHEVL